MTSSSIKRLIFGRPLKSSEIEAEKMPIWKALPILSSDALSSVAYGTEQILLELATVGIVAFSFSIPIALSIIILISILVISYRQVITAYPHGGGAYMVSKENLGMVWGRLTGSSLLIDYTLTVAVSVSAGVQAITSAFPATIPYNVEIAVGLIWFMVWLNLRGTSEAGSIFAIPTYFFIICILLLIGKGAYDFLTGSEHIIHHSAGVLNSLPTGLTLFILLKAFSSGCSAVTGIEAISDAVPHFKTPSPKNANRTLAYLGILLAVIFGGVTLLAYKYGINPDPKGHTSVLSMVTEQAFGRGFMYYALQIGTMLILTLAANTSFNGFPILASIMAHDKNFPHMFANRGDRLSFNYGIVTLGILSSLLIVVFEGRTTALIPLYAIGVFLSFTLAQSGLVRKWLRERQKGWHFKLFVNGLGALVSLIVLMIFCITKFAEGAWIVIFIIPLILLFITKIHNHYEDVGNELRIQLCDPLPNSNKESMIIVPVAGIHRVVAASISYAKTLSPNVVAFYVSLDDADEQKMEERWEKWNPGVRLVIFKSRYRTVIKPLLEFIERIDTHVQENDTVMVLLPQFVPRKWWHRLLHNQSANRIRSKLLARKDIIVATVPYHLQD